MNAVICYSSWKAICVRSAAAKFRVSCGLRIRVALEDARCERGYVLYQSPQKGCPDCGRLEPRPSVTHGKLISEQSQVECALTAPSENPGV